MNISLDDNVHTTNSIKFNLFVLVLSPVTHADKVRPACVIFAIAFRQNNIGVKFRSKFAALVGLNPRVVVN